MSLQNSETPELLDRVDYLMRLYVPLAATLADSLDKFGKYREELQLIVAELHKRGISVEHDNNLESTIQTLAEQRGLI